MIQTIAEELGQDFKQAREKLGCDYKAIAKDICVSTIYLKAIDEGRFEELPERIFAMGFIRSYAASLNMDCDDAVTRYKSAVMKAPEGATAEALVAAGGSPMTIDKMRGSVAGVSPHMATYQTAPKKEKLSKKKTSRGKLNYSILGGFLAVVAMVATAGANLPSLGNAPSAPTAKPAAIVAAPMQYTLKASEDTWLRVMDNDTEIFNGVLKAGESYQTPNVGAMRFTTSNAGGLILLAGGKDMGQLGEQGAVMVNVAFTSETGASAAK